MSVKLVWDSQISPLRVELPFQDVETINESNIERNRQLSLFSAGRSFEWRNRLIWGDKKYVLPSLLPEFAGKVNLIYIDPPFDTGADFSYEVEVEGNEFTKEPSVIEQKAYRDTWGNGLDSYLQWFYETVVILYDLLAEDGSIYVHLDWHVGHYAKVILDQVFDVKCFQNEIVWHYSGWNKPQKTTFNRRHDTIFYYSKSSNPNFNSYSVPWNSPDEYLATRKQKLYSDEAGRQYTLDTREGGKRQVKVYLEESLSRGKPVDDVWDIDKVNNSAKEATGYGTQKPEALLERIITASSKKGDLVLDAFCGSGTTATVAEKLGRRWITCDLGRFSIHTARKRLLTITDVKPFVVQNLGKYERQLWQADEFGPNAAQRVAAYTQFILQLYHAQPLSGFTSLHGLKAGRVVHVGAIDSPVTQADVRSMIIEWKRNFSKTGTTSNGIDVLGWEFAFELNEVTRQQAQEAGVELKFYTIPREVLEKKAVDQGDIQFFELAALSLDHEVKGHVLKLKLTDFIAPLEYVDKETLAKISNWDAWIDYWAVDWDFKGDTFHNQWQRYRTRGNKGKKLELEATYEYEQPGSYLVQVKVIDIFGNDTTRTLKIEVL